ncbi:MAG: MarR family transcriptional regulator [Tissierellia bacterium]|jgi:DNA-binding MarR family transcriptional regulator|nr:MarR family transcriptional regulator [Tissierellia bacterium]
MDKQVDLLKRFIRLNSEMRKVIFNQEVNAQFSIGRKQLATLTALNDKGELNMTNLAREVGVSNQQLTKIVDVLVKRKLVQRGYNPNNRRVVLVSLTEVGIDYVEKMTDAIIQSIKGRGIDFNKKKLAEIETHLSYLEDFIEELLI